jgi:Recombination endonuclease VII.
MARKRRQSELPGAAELYERLLAEQGGVCAICGNPPKTRRLHVDHDHKTGRVRGLLCYRCNRLLASYVTAPLLVHALAYLGAHERLAERESAA